MKDFPIHSFGMQSGIRRTVEFEKKRLAGFAVNVGVKCSHGCTYCSSGALLRCHRVFKTIGRSSFEQGYAIVDPDMPEKVARDAAAKRKRGMVQLCTTVDAWCPAAQQYNLGRRCLEALLSEPGWIVRILTKNAAVVEEFDLIKRHKDRVLVGLSLTATPDKDDVIAVTEPNASSITDRMAALKKAHTMGLRTYGMLCPLLPGIANSVEQIEELVDFVVRCGAEEIFCEAVNARGPGLKMTEEALRAAGYASEAAAVNSIRCAWNWSGYARQLTKDIQHAVRKHGMIDRLRYLLYPAHLRDEDVRQIRDDDAGVIWL